MRSILFAACSLMLLGCPEPPPGVVTPDQTPTAPASGGAASGGSGGPAASQGTVVEPAMDDGTRIPPGMRIEPQGFGLEEGEGVKLSGEVSYAGGLGGQLRVEILQVTGADAAPVLLHAVNLDQLGTWSVVAPPGLGRVDVMAYVDLDQNGPDAGEPQGVIEGGVDVGDSDISGLDLVLAVPEPPPVPAAATDPEPVEGEPAAEALAEGEVPAEGAAPAPVGPPSADTPPEAPAEPAATE